MPLVAHNELPTFARLAGEGQEVLGRERAVHQDIRELHVGLLNMMPDAALQATERQFMRLVGACNRIAQFYVHPFTIPGIERVGAAREHVARHYEPVEKVMEEGLDALIITGANVTEPDITREVFWKPLTAIMDWALASVASTMMSCLSSHSAFKHYYGIDRNHLEEKQWGVYSHRVTVPGHPLVSGINTRFDTCHSRFNDVPAWQLEEAGLQVLVESDEAGVLLAVGPDRFRQVFLQGHPEYDVESLLKEYKREIGRFVRGEREHYPPFPQHYFRAEAEAVLGPYKEAVQAAVAHGREPPPLPEAEVMPLLDNTWADTGKAIFNNWLGLVYQVTNQDRGKPFMPGVDPNDPLGLRAPCSPVPVPAPRQPRAAPPATST